MGKIIGIDIDVGVSNEIYVIDGKSLIFIVK